VQTTLCDVRDVCSLLPIIVECTVKISVYPRIFVAFSPYFNGTGSVTRLYALIDGITSRGPTLQCGPAVRYSVD